MIKKIIILLFGLVGMTFAVAKAQQSAQASMRVTVTVVQGSQMQLSQPDQILIKQDTDTSLGQLTLDKKSEGNTNIRTNSQITLLAANGEQMDMDVKTNWKESGKRRKLLLTGLAHSQQLHSGEYKGELKTTLEYN